ncbi:MAG: beta-glucosidase [Robiginitomaculum sp.]|nr:MAG: beta-glucosidase [Robiginitomaculum sp.]
MTHTPKQQRRLSDTLRRGTALALISALALIAVSCAPNADTASDTTPATTSAQAQSSPEALLAQMTLEEKVAQLSCVWIQKDRIMDADGAFSPSKMKEAFPNSIGCIARPQDYVGLGQPGEKTARTIASSVQFANDLQKYMLEETRLGIPVIFHEEGLHGFMGKDATNFPQSIALASTWDPELIENVYTFAAREIRARGVHHVLSPVVDVVRDPRWGRIEETYGEDPYLVSRISVAAVKGFQGEEVDGKIDDSHVLTTLKHLTGHGQPESGTNVGPANISERVLREVFFPPFEAAINEANAASLMASYNEIDGVPSHVSTFLLQDILRGEWDFQGLVVSDYFAIDDLVSRHAVVADADHAAMLALETGVDLETPDPGMYSRLVQLVQDGEIEESVIDTAVLRVLRFKQRGNIAATAYSDIAAAERLTGNAEARALAEEAARRAIILLKNEGNTLPLNMATLNRIAVIGPNAGSTVLGGYSDTPRQTVSILDGIRAKVGDQVQVEYAEGVRISENPSWWDDTVELADRDENLARIKEATAIAKESDLIVLVIGGNEDTSREAWAESHLGDRSSLDLVGEQNELVNAMIATGKPIVVVLINGRPLAIPHVVDRVPAVIEGWILGQETGTAMADVLFGDYNPGGKLPVTIPRSVGQLPMFYNYKPTAHRGYAFSSVKPLYPFGYGLSYTDFSYSEPTLSKATIGTNGSTTVSVDVTNSGARKGDEIVQMYIRDNVSSVTRPVKELKGFERITLEAGETQTVTFDITPKSLRFYDINMNRVVEAGEFTIMTGTNSQDLKNTTLTVE